MTVHRWDEHFIYGRDHDQPEETLLKVRYADKEDTVFADLGNQLYEGAQLNLLSVKNLRNEGTDSDSYPYILLPEILILDPDFLIDITALCACMKPYGYSPYTHILNKFAPSARSSAIQLGNAANLFLDDCVNENTDGISEDELYLRSMQKSFRLSPSPIPRCRTSTGTFSSNAASSSGTYARPYKDGSAPPKSTSGRWKCNWSLRFSARLWAYRDVWTC